MAHLSISLPDDVAALAQARAQAGGFADLSAYLAALVRADDDEECDPALAEALAEGERGPFVDCDFEAIIAEARAKFRRE
ncbi:MAG: hypothetical protein A4S12_09780 [Proteobacteria bacterium SG_bin5]|nr:hypothetical protein [Sphingomonas sp.]OQW40681.1 MAG: hypothetical protein A4S12_09780 [Proteobacteria bacterium SG_bin5]